MRVARRPGKKPAHVGQGVHCFAQMEFPPAPPSPAGFDQHINWVHVGAVLGGIYCTTMLAVIITSCFCHKRGTRPFSNMEDGERNDQIGTSGGSGFLNDFTPRTANNRPKSWHAAAKANQVIDLSTIDRSIKMAFVRKVYAILATQLALTVAIVAGFIYESFVVVNGVPDPKQPTEFGVWVSGSYWVFGMLFVPAIGILCFLFTLKNRYPHNYLLLFAFTVLESATLGWVCQLYYSIGYGSEILLAFGITLAIFCALTLFTMQSRIDCARHSQSNYGSQHTRGLLYVHMSCLSMPPPLYSHCDPSLSAHVIAQGASSAPPYSACCSSLSSGRCSPSGSRRSTPLCRGSSFRSLGLSSSASSSSTTRTRS